MRERPEISVIVPTYNAATSVRACLDSLRRQRTARRFEIIVVDSSTDGTDQIVQREYPECTLRHFAQRRYCGAARNIGIARARADIVAGIDADCTAASDWIERIALAHAAGELVVGGAIANGNPESRIGWAGYFCEFSRWLPGSSAGALDDLAGANISYRRELFSTFGPLLEGGYCSDTEFHWRLLAAGHRLHFDPQRVVTHRNLDRLGALLGHEVEHGLAFARMRVRSRAFTRRRRLGYVASAPLLGLWLCARMTGRNLRHRIYLRQFIGTWPLAALAVGCWTAGEVIGYARPGPTPGVSRPKNRGAHSLPPAAAGAADSRPERGCAPGQTAIPARSPTPGREPCRSARRRR